MDNPELARIAETLERLEKLLQWFCDREQDRLTIDAEQKTAAAQQAEQNLELAARAAASWPWAPGTQEQGFLSGRWNRWPGDSYAAAATRGAPGPNSPIRGGDDSGKEIDVPSGAKRS